MNSPLRLTVGCGIYDRTLPLVNSTIRPSGLSLEWSSLPPQELFAQVLEEKYSVGEMSLAYLSLLFASGDRRFVGLPIFLSRMFRHSALFVRSDSSLRPEELRQRRIGVSTYTMTAAVWVRWFLRVDYDILPEQLEWFVGGISPVSVHSSPTVHTVRGGPAELERMLLAGDIDVLLSVVPPKSYANGSLRRLWPNSRETERASSENHKMFPIMHSLVMLRSVYEEQPWAVESLFNAFWEAKELCYKQLLDTDAPHVSLPWLCGNVEEAQRIFGTDYWPYGIGKNRRVLTSFFQELHLERLVEESPRVEDIFLPLDR